MATLGMMYFARGGLVWGQMKGCYLKSWGLQTLHRPIGGLYNILLGLDLELEPRGIGLKTLTRCIIHIQYCHILLQELHIMTGTTEQEWCFNLSTPDAVQSQKHLIVLKSTAYGGKAHHCQAPVHDELQHLCAHKYY